MIEIRDLQFAYRNDSFSVHVERLSIGSGERVCWIGPSGSGKTTLLHLVAGILASAEGQVNTCGVELATLGDRARRAFRIANVGLVFQDFRLLDYLTVLDNILLPYRISSALTVDASVRERAQALASDVGLGELLKRYPTHLSQGECQRVAVCRAIIARPKLLLADEPTANLDPENAARVLATLEGYAIDSGATLVVVSHDRDVQSRFDKAMDVATFCQSPSCTMAEGGHA